MQKPSAATPKPRIAFEGCPLCRATGWRELRIADCTSHPLYRPVVPKKMRWLECTTCRHVYTDGYFAPEVLAAIFSRTQDNQTPGHQIEQQRVFSARMVERVAQFAKVGIWLDVGFGSGSLLLTAEEWGFKPLGLDLRRSSVDGLKKIGIEAHAVEITEFPSREDIAVVSMADVLEHMPFPSRGLEAAHRLLAPEGVLLASMPHYNCATWRVLDQANGNPYWMEIEHYHNFSRERLYSLLRDTGFEPICYGVSERYRVCMEVIARRRA